VKYAGLNLLNDIIEAHANSKMEKVDSDGIKIKVGFQINEPALKNELEKVINELRFSLPESYVEFLSKFDGGDFYNYEDLDGFRFFGTKDIVKMNENIKNEYEDDWINEILIFAECIGEGNYLGFKFENNCDRYKVLDCFHEELPSNWVSFAENFDEFLEKLVLNNGNKYWL